MVSLDKDFINFSELVRTFDPLNPSFIQKFISWKRCPKWIWQRETCQNVGCHFLCNCSHTLHSTDSWDVREGLQWMTRQKDSCVPFSAAFLSPSWVGKQLLSLMCRGIQFDWGEVQWCLTTEEADKTPEEASRINPGLKGMVSAKENPCVGRWVS